MSALVKTATTALVTGLVLASLTLLLKSQSMATELRLNSDRIEVLERRVGGAEIAVAATGAQLNALVTKVNEIWQVVVQKR